MEDDLLEEELERYRRNIMLPDIGREGQQRLKKAKVLVIGAGGLGSPVLMYLAAAGVGTIGVVDGDQVELSNLQRQITHVTGEIGLNKSESAARRMTAINPAVQVVVVTEHLRSENGRQLVGDYDLVVEATDNFETRFLVNDLCVASDVPFVHGGILEFAGQVMTVLPHNSCCYRCVFKKMPPPDVARSCSTAGVLGSVAGVVGAIQATEALKYLTGTGDLLTDCLLTFDGKGMNFRKLSLHRQGDCPACGGKK